MNIKIMAVFLLMLSGCMTQRSIKPEVSRPIITICSGCGSEWESYGPGDVKPITKCPNCPMTPEEFEALKEQVRKRKSKEAENE
jgi:hypothetical protein